MKGIFLIMMIFFFWNSIATPNRNQFKPKTIELDNECVAVLTCRLLDANKNCLKSEISVNTPNGYTNSVVLNEQQAQNRPINLVSFYPISSGVVVVTYNDKEELAIAQYVYSLDTRLFLQEGIPMVTSEFFGASTLDVASRSTQLTYDQNQYFIVVTISETSYLITANNTEFINQYNFNNDSLNELIYITSNDNGTLLIASQRRSCPVSELTLDLHLTRIDENSNVENLNTYSIDIPACLAPRSIQAKFLNNDQILITYVLDNGIAVASLVNPSNPTTLKSSDSQQNIPTNNFKFEKSSQTSRDVISSLLFDYSSISYNTSQISFSTNGSEAIISLLRCTNDCCNNCFIEGLLVDIDFSANVLSRKLLNGLNWDLPIVRSPNLGFDRVRFDGDYPLFRYNSLCFNTNLNYD
eukprot:TRINITY_DN2744_c0_g1_i1.p1 TRINITY_DN2744_c0_g1~~TRINITY_DN2744_c0_g1_i1.p1  ORF type:complete len:411 (-),score=95.49 TRINITY_DN2744_c0_g1_i1:20-1252(-)